MITVLRMPEVLANVTEVVLARWTVATGEAVALGDVLAELETEKALIDLESEQAGVLWRTLVDPGETVAVGSPIAVVGDAGVSASDVDAALVLAGATATIASETTIDVGSSSVGVGATPAGIVSSALRETDADDTRRFVSPLSRRLAREGGVDLSTIVGTGPGGRIVRRDIERALRDGVADSPATTKRPDPPGSSESAMTGYVAVPHTPMRRAIARRLSESTSTVPHFYVGVDCRVDELLALRARVNAASATKVSVNDMVIRAVARAFDRVPEANVTWTEEAMRRWEHVDVGLAVATEGGLVTPVVRHVEQLRLIEIAAVTTTLVSRARARTLRQEELVGGSIAVSNLGMYEVKEFSAIINPPQSAIFAVGVAQLSPVVVDGQLTVGMLMRCTLSVDHRAIDGALAASWVAAFKSEIENPVPLLL